MNSGETLDDIVKDMRLAATSCSDTMKGILNVFALRVERAARLQEIELREDEAKMLLREYAAAPSDTLTESARALKQELLSIQVKEFSPIWKERCARCNEEGLRDDEKCEYYGEPCGCNSPYYGEHPILRDGKVLLQSGYCKV